jgi:hypothetical protein
MHAPLLKTQHGRPVGSSIVSSCSCWAMPGHQPNQHVLSSDCADKSIHCPVSRRSVLQFLGTFHQCVKRELPYEAVHLYQKIKQAEEGKPDLALCNGLLNVAVGELSWLIVGSSGLSCRTHCMVC